MTLKECIVHILAKCFCLRYHTIHIEQATFTISYLHSRYQMPVSKNMAVIIVGNILYANKYVSYAKERNL